jgi:DNA-binding XRE family transcriptional regulator
MRASPFKRLREISGLTTRAFAAEAGISRQAIANLEAGMYQEVPLRANTTLAAVCREHGIPAGQILTAEYGQGKLNAAMDVWKQQKRAEIDLHDWPVLTIREIMARFSSPGAFCRDLCIPSSAIYHLHYGKTDQVPDVIIEALKDAGYKWTAWL